MKFDTIIVGQGLAGTTLAWQLIQRGRKVLVVDEQRPRTASRIAAGLITPITGQRMVRSWRFDEFWPTAVAFYRRVERETSLPLFREIPMLRIFKSADERGRFLAKTTDDAILLNNLNDSSSSYEAPQGGFEMMGGRLDVPTYLAASRTAFQERGFYQTGRLEFPGDLELSSSNVTLPNFGCSAERIVFCQGFAAGENPWFQGVPFDPAKGEILNVKLPGFFEERVVHCGIWLAPDGGETYRVGATYDRERLDEEPTEAGLRELTDQLRRLLLPKRKLTFCSPQLRSFAEQQATISMEVMNHHAALRPIVLGRHPVIGLHPANPRLGFFNGLGSKGSLQAPFVAGQFADLLAGHAKLEPIFDLQSRFDPSIWNA